MQISITEAKEQLTELVRCAEADDEVAPTRHGPVAVKPAPTGRRRAVISRVRAAAASKRTAVDTSALMAMDVPKASSCADAFATNDRISTATAAEALIVGAD